MLSWLNISICYAQGGVVSTNISLNNRVTDFISNNNCCVDELYDIVQDVQNLGALEEGLRLMNVAVQKFPDNYFPYYMRGFYYKNMEMYDKAISDFSASIALEPRYAAAVLERGECYLLKGMEEEACTDFESAIRASHNLRLQGLEYNGMDFTEQFALVGLGHHDEVRKWIKTYKGDEFYNIACLFSKMKDPSSTIKYLRLALDNKSAKIRFVQVDNCMKWLRDTDEFQHLISDYK